jgi:hypothetical protein
MGRACNSHLANVDGLLLIMVMNAWVGAFGDRSVYQFSLHALMASCVCLSSSVEGPSVVMGSKWGPILSNCDHFTFYGSCIVYNYAPSWYKGSLSLEITNATTSSCYGYSGSRCGCTDWSQTTCLISASWVTLLKQGCGGPIAVLKWLIIQIAIKIIILSYVLANVLLHTLMVTQ